MTNLLAAGKPLGPLNAFGTLGNTANPDVATTFVDVLSKIIGVLTVVGALWFIFQLFAGAIAWISAGSDKQALDNAKKRLTNALVGLLIVIISYTLIAVVGFFLGIDIINLKGLIINSGIK